MRTTVPTWQNTLLKILARWDRDSSEKNPFSLTQARARAERISKHLGLPPNVNVAKYNAGGVPVMWLTPCSCVENAVVLHFHGGGYVMGSAAMALPLSARIAVAARVQVVSVDYRLAPEHPFPAAVEDAVSAYRWLVRQEHSPTRVFLAGESAGGGLTLACLLSLRDAGERLPEAAVLLSPWLDLEATGASAREQARADPVLTPATLNSWASLYMGNLDRREPLASPLYADPSGLPPILIQVGKDEILLDDSVRFTELARKAGVSVDLELWPGMMHIWHIAARWLPEGQQAIDRIGAFIRRYLR